MADFVSSLHRMPPFQIQALMGSKAHEIRDFQSKELAARIDLGHLLHEIQDRHLWDAFAPAYHSWGNFLDTGFEVMTGFKTKTAYDAMDLAKCKALGTMPEVDLKKIPSVAVARHLARMERTGVPITPEVIAQAQDPNTKVAEFRRANGASEGYMVKFWVADEGVGKAIQEIVSGFLYRASADALCNFADLLKDVRLLAHAEGVPDNVLDFLVASAQAELDEVEAEVRAKHGMGMPMEQAGWPQ